MSELATLGTRFISENAAQVHRDLDQYAAKAKIAGDAGEAAAGGTRILSASMHQVVDSVQRAERELVAVAQHERSVSQAADMAAASTRNLGMAVSQVSPALSKAAREAQAASVSFEHFYDTAQQNFATQYVGQMGSVVAAQGRAAGSAKVLTQTGLNLSRQFADIGVTAAMGMSPLMILIQQGPQVADAFAQAKSQGLGFKDALGGIAKGAANVVATWAPLIAVGGVLVGAFMLWRKHADEVKAANERMAAATVRAAESQDAIRTAFSSASAFAEKYEVSNANLTKAIDGVILSQNAAYSETMKGIGAMDGASQAAVRRAEMERIATVAILKRAAAEAEARAKLSDLDAKAAEKTANRSGMFAAIGLAGNPEALRAGQDRSAEQFRKLGGEAARKAAASEREYAAALKKTADEMLRAKLVTPEAQKAREDAAKAMERAANKEETAGQRAAKRSAEEVRRAKEATAEYIAGLERELQAVGQTSNAIRRLAAAREIEIALKRGDMAAAERIRELILETEKMEDLAKSLEEVAKLRKAALEAARDPISTIPQGVVFDRPDEIAELAREFERAARAADEIRYAVDDVYYGIRDKNWAGAFAGLFRVIEQLKVAFDTAGTRAERMAAVGGAVGGVLSGVGGAVGGRAGSVIGAVGSGFSAAGAAAGMAGSFGAIGGAIAGLAGPIGIAVAGFSLLGSVLGGDKAKKRAKAEQEARDIQNAMAIAQERANQQVALELRILELSGDELGALNRRRDAEVAALDAANQALARHVHALEDWVKAVAAAKDAQSKAEDDLRTAYGAERDRLQGIINGVEVARDRLRDAYQRERSAIDATISTIRNLVDSLTDFRRELDLNPLAANDPAQQYAEAGAQFRNATSAELPRAGSAFVEASLGASATRMDFERDLAAVRRRTEEAAATAQGQLSAAEQQLQRLDAQVAGLLAVNDNLVSVDQAIQGLLTAEAEAALAAEEMAKLDTQVGALISINSSVLSVAAAISNLEAAIAALAAAEAAKPTQTGLAAGYEAVGFDGYVDKNQDLAALYASGSGMAKGRSKEEFGAYHWQRYGQGENRYFRPFDKGGIFTNSIVSQPTTFHNSVMGEKRPEAIMPLVMGPDGLGVRASNDSVSREEFQAMRRELETANRTLTAIMMSNRSMEKQGDRIEAEGLQVRGEDPGDPVMTVAA